MAETPQPDENTLKDTSWRPVPPSDSGKPRADLLDDRQRIQKAINERGVEALIQSGVARRVNNNDFNKSRKRSRYGLEGLTLDDGAILFKNNAADESYIALYIPGGPHAGIRLLGATESRSEAATGSAEDLSPSPAPDTTLPPADAPPPADTSATDTKAETHEPTPEEILNEFHAERFHEPFADFSLQRILEVDPKKIDETPPRDGGKWKENYLAHYRKEREVYLKHLQEGTATEREGKNFKDHWRIHASNLKNQFVEVYFSEKETDSRYYGNRVLQNIQAERFIGPNPLFPQVSEALPKVYKHLRDTGELDQVKAQMMKTIRLSIGYKALTDSATAATPWESLLPQTEYSEMQQYAAKCARIADILLLDPTHSLEELDAQQREILQDVIYEMRNEGDIEKAVAMETRLQKWYQETPPDKRALWQKDIRESLMTAYDHNLESAEGILAAFPKLKGQRDELSTHALDSDLSGGLWMDRVEDYQRFLPLMIAQDSINIAYDKQRSIKDDMSREYQTQKQPAAVDLAYAVNLDRKSAAVAHYITLKQREQFRPLVRRACLESLINPDIWSLETWASFGYDINVRFLKDKDTFKALWRNMEDANNRPHKQRHNKIGHIKEGLQARIAMHPRDEFWKWCLEYVTERERAATTPAPVDTPPPENPPADTSRPPVGEPAELRVVPDAESRETIAEDFDVGIHSIASEEHPGRNEDATISSKDKKFFGVFDGVGGHNGGQVASQEASRYVKKALEDLPVGLSLEKTQATLEQIFRDAHDLVFKKAQGDMELHRMGTTASVVQIWEGASGERKAVIANIGDSRVYICHADGRLEQVTLDAYLPEGHYFERQQRQMQEALSNATNKSDLDDIGQGLFDIRNIMNQALGLGDKENKIKLRLFTVNVQDGEKIIVTSDGIHDNLTNTEIATIVNATKNSQQAVEDLTKASLERSRDTKHLRHKPDDMSAIVVDFPRTSREGAVAPNAVPLGQKSSEPDPGLANVTTEPVVSGEPTPRWTKAEMDEIESYIRGYADQFKGGSRDIMKVYPPNPADTLRFEGFRRAVETLNKTGKRQDLRDGIMEGFIYSIRTGNEPERYLRRWEQVGGIVTEILAEPTLRSMRESYKGIIEARTSDASPEPATPPAGPPASREPVRAAVPTPPARPEPVAVREPAPTAPAETERRELKKPQDVARERAREILQRKFDETHDEKYRGSVAEEALTRMILRKYHEHRNV